MERNISALFKTAKCEIERKDRLITDLRKELDNLKFRRENNKKGQKVGANNGELLKELEIVKCVIEQKDRIIQSLTSELENVKKEFLNQEKQLKRSASHFEDDDLRSKLGKKRKLSDKIEYKRDMSRRPRSRSKSRETRYNSRSKPQFDKKRTIRRHRSGSFEKRRNSMIEKHRSRYENSKYSKSRSRSPASHKKYNNPSSEKSRSNNSKYPEKLNKIKSRSRSSSIDRKKPHRQNEKAEGFANHSDKIIKCEKKVINSHLIKEDSGMSSSNSHTSELLQKYDEIKAELLEELKAVDLEEGEIDCTLEDVNSDEDNLDYVEKVSVRKENTQRTSNEIITKVDKKETKKPNILNERPKKVIENKVEIKNIVVKEKEVKPAEAEHKNTDRAIGNFKTPELKSELVTEKPFTNEENVLNNDFKNPHDVLELMVQSNYLDELDIDEEIVKMRLLEDEKRKKRKEDKDRISKLRFAISECKQNIELLEHNFCSDEETETEDEFNRTESCVEKNIVNTKQNNLVLKISKGSIVVSNVKPKTDTLKDDKEQNHIQKSDDVMNKNQLDSSNKEEIVFNIEEQIQNDVDKKSTLSKQKHIKKPEETSIKNPLETNKKENTKAHIQKSNEILPKNTLDADIKASTKHVKSKCVKEIPKIENSKSSKDSLELKPDKDIPIIKGKPLENDNQKKRKNTDEKCTKTVPSSKQENPEKLTTNKNINTNTRNDKTETCVLPKTTESVEFKPKLTENITEHELLEAISTIVEDVKVDGNKFEQNFANITNLESAVPDGQDPKPAVGETLENKLNEILDVENKKKENATQEVSDKETNNRENEPQRKAPLKARRRRAFICIT